MTTKKELQDQLDLVTKRHQSELDGIKKQIAALPDDEVGVGVPEMRQEYFTVNSDACILSYRWKDLPIDKERLEMGNVFFTREEAQDRVNHMKALAKLRSLTKGFVPDWKDAHQDKYWVEYDGYAENHVIDYVTCHQGYGLVHFATEEDAEEALKIMGDQMDHLLKGGW